MLLANRLFSASQQQARIRRLSIPLLAAGLLATTVLIVRMIATTNVQNVDFRYIWVAARIWALGGDPYSGRFVAASHIWVPHAPFFEPWFYPFHAFVLTTPFGLLGLRPAFLCWSIVCAGAGIAAILLANATAAKADGRSGGTVATLALLLFCLSSTCWELGIHEGQMTCIATLGIPLAAWGLMRSSPVAICGGAVMMLLKPQIGIPCVAALAMMPGAIRPVLIATILTILLSIPAIILGGGLPVIAQLVGNTAGTGGYQLNPMNRPPTMNGVWHLIYLCSGHQMRLVSTMAIATLAAIVAAGLWRSSGKGGAASPQFYVTTIPAIVGFTVGLHDYDLISLFFCAPTMRYFNRTSATAIAAGLVVLWRPWTITNLVAASWPINDHRMVSELCTLGAALILFGVLAGWARYGEADGANSRRPAPVMA